jgi:multiple sugar transport system substrate-binding protein
VQAFAAEAPAVQVEADHAADWLAVFRAAVAGGSALDALSHSHDAVGGAVRDALVENLEPFLARQRDYREQDFERGAWGASQYEGKRWGLPWEGGAYALVFNADLLQAANLPAPDPKKRMTWDDLLGMARRLTVDGAGKHPTDQGFDRLTTRVYGFAANTSWGLATFIMSSGGELLTADGKVPVDGPEALEALQFVADLQAKHQVVPQPAAPYPSRQPGSAGSPAGEGGDAGAVAFEQGNVAMAYEGAWRLRRFNAAGLRWGALPAPLRRTPVSGAHYSPLVLSRTAPQKDAAWAWLAFATLSETGQRLAVDAGQLQPYRRSLEARFVEAETPPAATYRQAFADELKGGTLRVAGDRAGSYWGGHKREWARLWHVLLQPLLRGEKGAMPVAGSLRRHTELLLKLGRSPIQLPP